MTSSAWKVSLWLNYEFSGQGSDCHYCRVTVFWQWPRGSSGRHVACAILHLVLTIFEAIIIVTIMGVQKVFANERRPIQCPLHSLNLVPINKSLAQSLEYSRGASNYLLNNWLSKVKGRGSCADLAWVCLVLWTLICLHRVMSPQPGRIQSQHCK